MLTEEKGDLFSLDDTWALAHCVGSDFIMGRGIAVTFKEKYGNQDWLLKNSKGIGSTLLLSKDMCGCNVFYMVTKQYSRYSKPTYESIKQCLIDMFNQATQLKITKIGIPRIGCGLDGKDWNVVKKIIEETKPKEISVKVFYL